MENVITTVDEKNRLHVQFLHHEVVIDEKEGLVDVYVHKIVGDKIQLPHGYVMGMSTLRYDR